jgi:hypothetical protein
MMVSAAKNKCILLAKVKSCSQASSAALKFNLELEIADSIDVDDYPNFGKRFLGSTVAAFSVQDLSLLKTGDRIRCEAEYVGGPFNVRFRVTDVSVLPTQ